MPDDATEVMDAGLDTGAGTITEPSTDTFAGSEPQSDSSETVGTEQIDGQQVDGTTESADAMPPWEENKETLPKTMYAGLRELKALVAENPVIRTKTGEEVDLNNVLRELSNTYGRLQGYTGVHSRVEDARIADATLKAFGGFDGISKLQSAQERAMEIDDMLDRGDPEMIRQMAESSPKGFARLVPHALQQLEKVDRQAYNEAVLGPMLDVFSNVGLKQALTTAMEELKAGTPDGIARASNWIANTARWLDTITQQHETLQNRYKDPRIEEFQREQASSKQQQSNAFYDEVDRMMNIYMRDTIKPEVTRMAKGRNFTGRTLDEFVESSMEGIRKSLKADEFFKSSVKALARGRDPEKAMLFIKPKIDSARMGTIKELWTLRYGSGNSPVRRQQAVPSRTNGNQQQAPTVRAGAGSSAENAIPVRVRPDTKELDMSKDPNNLMMIQGVGFLKSNQRWVTWKPGRAR